MEQLTVTTSGALQGLQTAGRMIEVAMLTKKVKLRLNREQLAVIGKIMNGYLMGAHLGEMDEKVIFFLIWELYETKIRKKMLDLKQDIGLSLDLPAAWALMQMFYSVDLSPWPYESTIANQIISEIDHQTA